MHYEHVPWAAAAGMDAAPEGAWGDGASTATLPACDDSATATLPLPPTLTLALCGRPDAAFAPTLVTR